MHMVSNSSHFPDKAILKHECSSIHFISAQTDDKDIPTIATPGTLHGGAISLLVDVLGTMALLTRDPKRAGVSVELNCSFCAPAKMNERIRVHGKVLKYGKTLGFTEVTVSRISDGVMVATGRHTKALG
jgi:acyl-coenzyme A thioesterase 13